MVIMKLSQQRVSNEMVLQNHLIRFDELFWSQLQASRTDTKKTSGANRGFFNLKAKT